MILTGVPAAYDWYDLVAIYRRKKNWIGILFCLNGLDDVDVDLDAGLNLNLLYIAYSFFLG
jgi:hypothetical protein